MLVAAVNTPKACKEAARRREETDVLIARAEKNLEELRLHTALLQQNTDKARELLRKHNAAEPEVKRRPACPCAQTLRSHRARGGHGWPVGHPGHRLAHRP